MAIVLESLKCHFPHEATPMQMERPLSLCDKRALYTSLHNFQPQPTNIWTAVCSLSLEYILDLSYLSLNFLWVGLYFSKIYTLKP